MSTVPIDYFEIGPDFACPHCGRMKYNRQEDIGRKFKFGTHASCADCGGVIYVVQDGILPCNDKTHDIWHNHFNGELSASL